VPDIPKGSDFTNITEDFLEEVEKKLNERPRKRHVLFSLSICCTQQDDGLGCGKLYVELRNNS